MSMVFTKSGDRLITAYDFWGDVHIRARNMDYKAISTIRRVANYMNDETFMAVGQEDATLALARSSGVIELWDLNSLTQTKTMVVGDGKYDVLSNLHFSPNGESLLAATKSKPQHVACLHLWTCHLPTERQIICKVENGVTKTGDGDYPGIYRAGFSPDNLTCWAIAGPTLFEWEGTKHGLPKQNEYHRYPSRDTIAISEDRITVAYNSYEEVVTVGKFMHTIDHCIGEDDHDPY
jgi:WD40 repeat protein